MKQAFVTTWVERKRGGERKIKGGETGEEEEFPKQWKGSRLKVSHKTNTELLDVSKV